jgi:3-deoxy-D-manno-octulosonic-acid transferase
MLKRFMRSQAFLTASSRMAASYLRLVRNRAAILREPADFEERLKSQAPCIVAMWHGQFLMIPALAPASMPWRAMVATHGDGEVVAQMLQRFGIGLIRGAGAGARRKDRGGAKALRAAIETLKDGASVPMTADVPPGPARIAGTGIVTLARLSGRPVVPVAVATSRFRSFSTWSRFTFNLPSAKLATVMGEPVTIARDASPEEIETARRTIETELNEATRRAYALVGRDMSETLPAVAGGILPRGLTLHTYRALSAAIRPAAGLFLWQRSRRGKEVAERLGERMGHASAARPAKRLLWFHAASVGETNAILPLIDALRRERPELGILLTTVTVTSSRIAASRLPEGAIHQFVPLDTPAFVSRFFDHWQPDAALFTESEIWPNLIVEAKERGIPLALLNARMSDRSFRRWLKMPGFSRALFSRFDIVLAQSDKLAKRLGRLGAPKVIAAGNLKYDAPPPPIDKDELTRLRAALYGRPLFLAASTHPGEDELILAAHRALKAGYPRLLTIIVPRHPERGASVAELADGLDLAASLRSRREAVAAQTDIYVSDTIGELGLYYSLAPFAFIGGSLVTRGGQNPIEAVKLGAAVITGPHWHNFPEVYQALADSDGCRFVADGEELTAAVREMLSQPERLDQVRANAEAAIAERGGALRRTLDALEPLLPPRPAQPALAGACYAP